VLFRSDPLAIAQLLALVADVTAEEALTAVGDGARLALRRGRAGASLLPTVGAPADLVSLAASTPVDALARADPSRLVLHRGLVVSSRRLVDEGALTVLGDVLSSGGGR
jgi:cytosine/adenosine deaminase-related metal-dependent hydrolase